MGKKLSKKEQGFFDLLSRQADQLVIAADLLSQLITADRASRLAINEKMHDAEHTSDDVAHKLVQKMNKSFVTPFDRDDIYELSNCFDDCMDLMDEASDLICLYKLGELPSGIADQVEVLARCAEATTRVPKLLGKRDKKVKDYWMEIHQLENQADGAYRRLLAHIFEEVQDPIHVIKLKDVIEALEEATDNFERLAVIVETIVVKES